VVAAGFDAAQKIPVSGGVSRIQKAFNLTRNRLLSLDKMSIELLCPANIFPGTVARVSAFYQTLQE
jgi:hypothetical protein